MAFPFSIYNIAYPATERKNKMHCNNLTNFMEIKRQKKKHPAPNGQTLLLFLTSVYAPYPLQFPSVAQVFRSVLRSPPVSGAASQVRMSCLFCHLQAYCSAVRRSYYSSVLHLFPNCGDTRRSPYISASFQAEVSGLLIL